MMDDIQAQFFPRFSKLAKERLTRGLEVTGESRHAEAAQLAREMHAIAGEAGLLGFDAVCAAARGAEDLAAKFAATRDDADRAALDTALRRVVSAIEEITP
jgi:HPt (histidine-containing phosphotransfer) domain-containing protein